MKRLLSFILSVLLALLLLACPVAAESAADGNPYEILREVRSAVDTFVGDAEQFDDLTMMCLEYKGPLQ